jgi:hypothetical protein
VKVELGIPYELWDKPPAEVTNMKTQVWMSAKLSKIIQANDFSIKTSSVRHFWKKTKKQLRNGILISRMRYPWKPICAHSEL